MDTTKLPTLLDIKKIDGGIGYDMILEAITTLRPELQIIPADTLTGTSMELSVLTGLPTVAFRNLNEGTALSKPSFENRTFQCGIIDQPLQADKRAADVAKDRGRFLMNYSMPFLEAALNHISKQFYYGVGNDAKGFIGLIAQSNPAATHVVDATGSDGTKSSVWLLTNGRAKLEWLFGSNETIQFDRDWKDETAYDADGNAFPALTNWVKGRPGMRLADKRAAVRIKNLTTQNGKGLTDTLLFSAIKLANDLGMNPTDIVMNSRSREQLRQSRITALIPAPPLPNEFEGIPIRVSTSIINAETI